MTIKLQQKTYSPLAEGFYPVRITGIEETTGQYGEQLKFTCTLLDLPDRFVFVWCSKKFVGGIKPSKLYKLTKAALGVPIPSGMELNSDQLIGRMLKLHIVQAQTEKGISNRIEGVLPYDQKLNQIAPPQSNTTQIPSMPPEDDKSIFS